ncbi:ABC transporter permease [Furfurilactobacillus siliginis]|uniref:ABC transporter permease n=1 Tax=Furfurilactobacillus siliginis TaxID=348151 RepID=A0A0R2L5Q2_9LACO|nr:ABC transporter permease [Furfurilactobacillus siliginis]KRN97112.1 multidrug ABC superfamily ATP binding cassette transporter, permease protein [Furfurilactobacillus siliginis]GEK29396.1 ABC transporter permease [Furfurilactobacillus siliginis]
MRILAMIKRVFREMLRDKRTLALMFIAPLFILSLVYFLFQGNATTTASLATRGVDRTLVTAVKNKHIELHSVSETASPTKVIREHNYAGMITQDGHHLTVTLANTDQSKTAIIKQGLQAAQVKLQMQAAHTTVQKQALALKQMSAALRQATGAPAPKASRPVPLATYHTHFDYLYGSDDSTFFDTLLPIMTGFVVFFFVFLISGIALLRERTTGTLYRLLATPVKRGEIVAGYLIGYGTFAFIQTLLVVLFTIYVFKVQILGSVGLILLINVLLAVVALTLGLLISTFAASEFQMIQFIPIVAIPQIFFAGIIPISSLPHWLQPVSYIMPLYYGASGMSAVVQKGATFVDVLPNMGVLLLFAIVFLVLNLITMRRYRQV